MKIKKLPIYLLTLANTLIALGLLATGYSHILDPRTFGWLALAGYTFPIFLAATLAFLAFWIFVKKRYALISILALLIAYQPVTLYCPLNPSTPSTAPDDATVPDVSPSGSTTAPDASASGSAFGGPVAGGASASLATVPDASPSGSTLTILTYNTHNLSTLHASEKGTNIFTPADTDSEQPNHILQYLADSGADILCLQEFSPNHTQQLQIEKLLLPIYHYRDSVHHNTNSSHLWIYSKYPVRHKQLIPYKSNNNISAAFWLDVNGREVIVINNHLEITGLSIKERTNFSQMMHGKQERDTMRHTSRAILSRLTASSKLRAAQADAIAAFIRQHTAPTTVPRASASGSTTVPDVSQSGSTPVPGASASGSAASPSGPALIVCGDFNDIPQSYTYHNIADGLTDCYRQCGTGPGYTFSHYGMRVRIDNILCSNHLTPLSCHVDNTVSFSDHYPVIAKLYLPPTLP